MAAARARETLIDTLCNQYSPELQTKVHEDFTKTETAPIAEKAPTRAFSWLKADIQLSAFTFKKQAHMTLQHGPLSVLNTKLLVDAFN